MERLLALVFALVALLASACARTYERCELARELVTQHGVPLAQVPTWVCIAYHESRLDTTARNYASGDHGLLQISELFWCDRGRPGKACDLSCEALVDDNIADDVRCARAIYEEHTRLSGDGFTAWVVYPLHCKGARAKKYVAECADEMGKWRPSPRAKSLLDVTPRPRQKFTYYPDIDKLKPITRGPWQDPPKYRPFVSLNELVPRKVNFGFENYSTIGDDAPFETFRANKTEVGSGTSPTPSTSAATTASVTWLSPSGATEVPLVRSSSTIESTTSYFTTTSPKPASTVVPTIRPWWVTSGASEASRSSSAPRSSAVSVSTPSAGSTLTTSPPWWATRASSSWRTIQTTARPPISFGPSTTRSYFTYSKSTASASSVGSIFDLYLKPKKLQRTWNQNSTEPLFDNKDSSAFKFPKPHSIISWNSHSLSDAKLENIPKTALGNDRGPTRSEDKTSVVPYTSFGKKTTSPFKFDWSPFLSTKKGSIEKLNPYSSQETVTRATSNKYSSSKEFKLKSPFFDFSRSSESSKGSTFHINSASTAPPAVSYTLRPLSFRAASTVAPTTTSRPSFTFDAHNIFRYT